MDAFGAAREGQAVHLPVLAYYGTSRLQNKARAKSKGELTSRLEGYAGWSKATLNHEHFTGWMRRRKLVHLERLAQLEHAGVHRLETAQEPDHALDAVVRAASSALMEEVASVEFSVLRDEVEVIFQSGERRGFSILSDGYRNLIALAADVAWRAVRLNPHAAASMPQEASGVVLIDEVALHLHPGWQRQVLPSLRRTFPKIQFVVSTHSPQVLSSVEPDCVRFLDAAGGAATPRVSEGLDTNTILRDLMGVPERPEGATEQLKEVERLIEEGALEEAERKLDDLATTLGADDPTVTGLRWELEDARSIEEIG